ncbi:MAG: toll/interleukin-1 receptor domain-containing protein [Verrucomicrobia bacterium]|nr:toll/interleukin-1 receptor domain-containing protein [Verrucomicrobiota bacterium]
MKDFFISYTKSDRSYAITIRGWLEDAGHSVVMQDPDFSVGSNFVLEMDRAAKESRRTIAVLSADYLKSSYTQPEWAAAFAGDPTGAQRRLVTIRVKPCELTGLLQQVVYVDIVGLDIESARQRILDQLDGGSVGGLTNGALKPVRKKPQNSKPKSVQQTANAGRDVFQAAGDLNVNKKEVVRPVIPREPHHITEAQAAEIRQRLNELGERDEKAGRGSTYGAWMNRFKDQFEIASYARLDAARFDDAIAWIKQQKAMNRSRLRRTSNKAWREDHYAIIYGCLRKLGWDKSQLYRFAFEKLEMRKPIQSLKELGEQNLEKLAGLVRRLAGNA